jgi:hypothetical protein
MAAEHVFEIQGTSVPPVFGRQNVISRLSSNLSADVPNHISIVGPRYSGKTVLLAELDRRMCQPDSRYSSVIRWDLSSQTPVSDEAFLDSLCKQIGKKLQEAEIDYGEHLISIESDHYAELSEVITILGEDKIHILLLWDGFDRALESNNLTGNLWDQLRELASNNGVITLVTASRRLLSELLLAEDAATSDFWNIFAPPVLIDVFSEDDRNSALAHCSDFEFEEGARTELMNWTGGFPLFFFALLNFVIERSDGGTIRNDAINSAALEKLDFFAPYIDRLLNDISPEAREHCFYLLLNGDLDHTAVPRQERDQLCSIGFARVEAGKIVGCCRLAKRHLEEARAPSTNLSHIFGRPEDFEQNVRQFLELRFSHIGNVNQRLKQRIDTCIRDLPSDPNGCMSLIRRISETAFELIWLREFGPEKKIPLEIVRYWNDVLARNGRTSPIETEIPSSPFKQCRLLKYLVGADPFISSRATKVTKSTYYHLQALHEYGNFGQHPDEEKISVGTAAAAILISLELGVCLEIELS